MNRYDKLAELLLADDTLEKETQMIIKQIVVTPAQAKLWLSNRDENQRPVRSEKVAAYARDIENGRWWTSPQPVMINTKGQLIDGQHRLLAVVRAERDVPMTVAYDVQGDYHSPIDVGIPRRPSDVLKEPSVALAAARGLLTLQCAQATRVFSVSELSQSLIDNEEALKACGILHSGCAGIRPGGWVVAGLAYAYPIDPDKVRLLCEKIRKGEQLSQGDPAYALRTRLASKAGIGMWGLAMIACTAARYELVDDSVSKISAGETAYKWLTTRRRVLGIPRTPSAQDVESVGGSPLFAERKEKTKRRDTREAAE